MVLCLFFSRAGISFRPCFLFWPLLIQPLAVLSPLLGERKCFHFRPLERRQFSPCFLGASLGGEFLEKLDIFYGELLHFILTLPPSYIIQPECILNLWEFFWVAGSIGLSAYGFLPLAMFRDLRFLVLGSPGWSSRMTMHRFPVLNFSSLGLWVFLFPTPSFPVVVGGGGFEGIPKIPSSYLDLGPAVRDRVRFAAVENL